MSQDYTPINCEFHDVLEATSVQRRKAVIAVEDASGERSVVEARITDLFAQRGVEYMRLDNGDTLRLDRILAVDGRERSAFESS